MWHPNVLTVTHKAMNQVDDIHDLLFQCVMHVYCILCDINQTATSTRFTALMHASWNVWLMQERRNSSALAMELHLSCINPSIDKNDFSITGSLWGESIGLQWIPLAKGPWRRPLIFSMLLDWTSIWGEQHANGLPHLSESSCWTNNWGARDWRCQDAHLISLFCRYLSQCLWQATF